ncbi:MAG TPA: adenylate/guanylate cyclase domain-containing protein [Thermoanaerobaculia bacterium]|nr:adenylate/guanylate cyclase domain-containing protein [Thermoanaerobaculia bacterium]
MRVSPRLRGALAGAAFAALIAILLNASPSLFGLEWIWSDLWTGRIARELPPDPAIVIVAVNEKSIQTLEPYYGRHPWTRELMARVVEEAVRGGARVVAFDILFDGENRNDPEGDRRFAAALDGATTVLGAQTGGLAQDSGAGAAWMPSLWDLEGSLSIAPVPLIAPDPLFSTADAIGTMQLFVEEKANVARRYRTLVPVVGGKWAPSLALATAAAVRSLPHRARWSAHAANDFLRIGDLAIPVDGQATFAIRWRRGPRPEGELSYASIDFDRLVAASLQREETPDRAAELDRQLRQLFEGKIAIVGYTASGLLDLRATPLSATSAGVEIHANALDNLLRGEFNRYADPRWVIVLLILSATLFGALAASLHSQAATAGLFILFAGAWLGASPLLLRQGIIAASVGPALAIAATWITITVVRFVAEQRRSSLLKGTFGRYVSPQVLDYLLENPDKVQLGGERRDLTILFSDIRGFTSISEASEPEEVVEMLNEYLTRMVDILLRHGGTLDKFIGDAVMGFWNAPTAVEDHARRAVLCAIEMIEETARLREEWVGQGKAELRIGIGINTGDAVVGNIGSSRVFGYTVIGDTVNLASRLESKNKDYGTEIIVSESTKERMGEDIPAFYLDEVRVKGKNLPVKIFEIRGRSS